MSWNIIYINVYHRSIRWKNGLSDMSLGCQWQMRWYMYFFFYYDSIFSCDYCACRYSHTTTIFGVYVSLFEWLLYANGADRQRKRKRKSNEHRRRTYRCWQMFFLKRLVESVFLSICYLRYRMMVKKRWLEYNWKIGDLFCYGDGKKTFT
jgi:hypothetical protein